MRVIINDASILIDFNKLGLLDVLVNLPYEFWIPDVIWEDELLSIAFKDRLKAALQIRDFSPAQVIMAQSLAGTHARLSLNDSFALILAHSQPGSLLLTSDALMCKVAKTMGIDSHGLFWALDQLYEHHLADAQRVHSHSAKAVYPKILGSFPTMSYSLSPPFPACLADRFSPTGCMFWPCR